MDILFSVIMPVYNAEKTLSKAIESVLNENNDNVELIIVNDGSTDNSESVILKYIDDERLSYYCQENSGVSNARNYGLSVAKGEYIAFIDSDDFFTKNAFVKLTEYINEFDSDIIGFGFYSEKITENDEKISTNANAISDVMSFDVSQASKELQYIFASSKIMIQTSWNKVFRRSIIEENSIRFNLNLVCYENLTFVFEFMNVCKKITFVPDILYHYCNYTRRRNVLMGRRSPELTSNVSVCLAAFVKIADKYGYTEEFKSFMFEQFFKDFTFCSKKIFLPENKISKNERLSYFSEFLDDEMFLYLKDKYFGDFKFYRILYFLHNRKLRLLAYWLYKRRIL